MRLWVARWAEGRSIFDGIIDDYGRDQRLVFGSLISDDKKIIIRRRRAIQLYTDSNGVFIPDGVEFAWQIQGQPPQLARLKVRAEIPEAVLRQLAADRLNSMYLEFFVRDGKPSFRWKLDRVEEGGRGPVLARGGDWSR